MARRRGPLGGSVGFPWLEEQSFIGALERQMDR